MIDAIIKYAPGMRIIVRGEEWMVKKVETNSFGNQTLHVIGLSELVKDYEAMFITDIEKEIEIVDPAKVHIIPDNSAFFRKSKLYIESQWRQKIPTDNKIHVGDKAAMDLMPFQLEPAQLALNKTRQRILIADTVGLGKTLEAGILMSELIARGKGKRILVVTVKSMMTQFQKEMWNRFTIPLVRLDSGKIQSVRAKIPSNYNPFFYYDKTIISVDTLKNDLDYRTHLENAWWDIIVIDEAHNVANRGDKRSKRGKLAELLANRSDTLIMLSATPHDGKAQSVASLMNMLNPTAIADPENYGPEDIKGLSIRRFKKDIQEQVAGSFKERKITIERCTASAEEECAYDIFADMRLQMDESGANGKSQLFKTSLEKSLFSSPAACIKSVEERLKKLNKKYSDMEMQDIGMLEELKKALERITPESFSRYQHLLQLLKSSEYGWKGANNDRIVIFTERIETMRYLAEQLRKDLGMSDKQIQTMYGGMSDKELQKIVDEFGRAEAPIKVLIASDVASEGINLHYLSHRLIHFDIPWSLMVFQQRNGRVDRYGQKEQPDIRYMLINSSNEKIKGDARIMEILVTKEEQAFKNIGDPAVLFGKFNAEEEEEETARAIETGMLPDEFAKKLDGTEEEFNPLELLMGAVDEKDTRVEFCKEETLFSDIEYIRNAFNVFTDTDNYKLTEMSSVEGVEIKLTQELEKKISKVMPEEAMPKDDVLRLSTDKSFCMKEMQRCMQNDMAEQAWPSTQYLWRIHPVFNWIGDKSSILYKRSEVPMLGIPQGLQKNEMVYIVAGLIPNRKSTPVVDDWFGVYFKNGIFAQIMTMDEVMQKSKLSAVQPNQQKISNEQILLSESLLPCVVDESLKIMKQRYQEYKDKTDSYIYEETERLLELENRHKSAQLSIFDMGIKGMERKKSEKEREIEKIFNEFSTWEKDTLEIEDNSYIRIIAVITGVM